MCGRFVADAGLRSRPSPHDAITRHRRQAIASDLQLAMSRRTGQGIARQALQTSAQEARKSFVLKRIGRLTFGLPITRVVRNISDFESSFVRANFR